MPAMPAWKLAACSAGWWRSQSIRQQRGQPVGWLGMPPSSRQADQVADRWVGWPDGRLAERPSGCGRNCNLHVFCFLPFIGGEGGGSIYLYIAYMIVSLN